MRNSHLEEYGKDFTEALEHKARVETGKLLSDPEIRKDMADATARETRIQSHAERQQEKATAGARAAEDMKAATAANKKYLQDIAVLSPEELNRRLRVAEDAVLVMQAQIAALGREETPMPFSMPQVIGNGYNTVRQLSSGGYEVAGRYRGAFSGALVDTGSSSPSGNALKVQLKGGYVTAGRTSFWVPYNDTTDTEFTITVPPRSADNVTWVYMEIPVEPHNDNVTCEKLWTVNVADGGTLTSPNGMTQMTDPAKYYPCIRSSTTYPSQLAKAYDPGAPDVQYDDEADVVRHGVFGPTILPVCNVIIGKITWDSASSIRKWDQIWQNGDIYVPVWRWRHCANDDGFPNNTSSPYSDEQPEAGVYPPPETASIHCVFGASFCSPICIVPWDLYDVHVHGGGAVPDDVGAGACG